MASQLTIRIHADDGIAVVSRSRIARSRALAVAAAAGSQMLAFTASAQNGDVDAGTDTTPIFFPEGLIGVVIVAAGAFTGAVLGVLVTRRKKKDEE